MAEYRYYLIPDAMTRAFPEQFEKQTPTEFFDNIADLEKRYHQLREMPYDIEQEQIGKQDKESAGPDCATICRPQDFFLNMSRTKRKRKLVEWLESCQENQVRVLDEKIPLLSFAVDFVTAYEYQKARGIKIHPGLWKDMRVDIFLVKKEN